MIRIGPQDKVSILVNRLKDPACAGRRLKDIVKGRRCEFRITAFDSELPGCFRDLNLKADYSWDYLSDDERSRIDGFFFRRLTRNWFRCMPQGRRIDDSKKDMLGRCIEFEFISANHSLVKHIAVIANLFKTHKPSGVIVIEDSPHLVNILRLFDKKYNFRVLKIVPYRRAAVIKPLVRDLMITALDFFVLRCIYVFKKYEGRIIIDHRLYKRFSSGRLKDRLLPCFFEKGLKARLQALRRGELYFPLRFASCFEAFLRRRVNIEPEDAGLFEYEGIIFRDAIKGYISGAFTYTLPRVMKNIENFEKFNSRKKVKAVVMRHDMKPAERNLILAARPLGIPTVVVQHGALGDPNINSVMCAAGITCVWGRASMEWYKGLGFGEDRIAVTGNPAYDELYRRISDGGRDAARRRVCAALNIGPEKKIIAFLTSSNHLFSNSFSQGDEMERMTGAILQSIRGLEDIQLVIKVHPYDEGVNRYHEAVESCSMRRNAAVVKDHNVFDILEASDLVIVMDSTSGFEALILGRPVIACNLNRAVTLVPYAERAVAIGVKNTDELAQAIRDGLYNKELVENLRLKRDTFLHDYVYKIDGQATKRIEDLVYNLLK